MVRRAVTVILLLVMINSVTMTGTPRHGVSSRGERLKAAFTRLKAQPNDNAVQIQYVKAFPHDYRRFLALFGAGGYLADGYQCDYIFALSPLQAHHSSEVGSLLVQLSKEAEYQADAPSCLQQVMAIYASHYTKSFAALLNQLSAKKREQVITFLADADVESNTEYPRIIKNLKQLNELELARKFQQAQTEGSK
jgi:hypothetical protein